MTARTIAARLNARPCGSSRWIARCPSHDDCSPSLSIAEGSGRRVLLFCHAGCNIDAVARALGVGVHELFDVSARPQRYSPRTQRKVTNDELRDALIIEMQRYRDAHGIEGALRTSEINAVRATVARRFGVVLPPVQRPLWEGSYGRECDPAWPAVFKWGMRIASIRLLGAPIDFDESLSPPRAILLHAEELAADAMRSLEYDARRAAREATA
jgi:hypothetical protein